MNFSVSIRVHCGLVSLSIRPHYHEGRCAGISGTMNMDQADFISPRNREQWVYIVRIYAAWDVQFR
jgi:hypothetical protein